MSTAPAGTYYDGDFSIPSASGPRRVEYPFKDRGDERSFAYRQKYWVARDSYYGVTPSPVPPLDTPGEGDTYLVGETDPVDLGGGICEFEREYAEVPRTRYEGEQWVFGAQYVAVTKDGATRMISPWERFAQIEEGSTLELVEVSMPTRSRLRYDYFLSRRDGQDIPLLFAPKWVEVNGSIYSAVQSGPGVGGVFGGIENSEIGKMIVESPVDPAVRTLLIEAGPGWVIVEDSVISRWRGNIWERVTRFAVPRRLNFGAAVFAGSSGEEGGGE
jgi:hypothetical protein